MKYLKQFIIKRKGKFVLSFLLLLLQVIGTLMIPALIAKIVDQGILKENLDVVLQTGVQMVVVALGTTVVAASSSWITSDLSARFGFELRSKLLHKSQDLSLQQIDDVGVSSMITRSTSDITNLQQTMGMMMQLSAPAPLIVFTSIVMTFMISPTMAWIQLGFMTILIGIVMIVIKKVNPLSSSIQKRLDRINQIVREMVTGVRVIRAFGNEAYEEDRSHKTFSDYAENMIRMNKLFAIFMPAVWLMMGALMALILWVGGSLVLNQAMAVGEITAVTEYSMLTISYLMMAASTLTILPKAQSCLKRVQVMLDTEPAIVDGSGYFESKTNQDIPIVAFENVSFAYSQAEEPVIQNICFTMHPGQTTAVIGSTGSGKSTLVDLLLRVHDVRTGQILLKGEDIRDLPQDMVRSNIGYVPQKAFLFSGTIAENLRMGKPQASDEDLWNALRIAQAEDFVRKLPDGLASTVAQGGTNFSGGQRQRLAIARALIKQASIFIFDDSFSALDVKTDAMLRKALRESVQEPTKLIIAQRVSTILEADQILVMDEGSLCGIGTHHQLLESCPVYASIVDSQMNREEVTS